MPVTTDPTLLAALKAITADESKEAAQVNTRLGELLEIFSKEVALVKAGPPSTYKGFANQCCTKIARAINKGYKSLGTELEDLYNKGLLVVQPDATPPISGKDYIHSILTPALYLAIKFPKAGLSDFRSSIKETIESISTGGIKNLAAFFDEIFSKDYSGTATNLKTIKTQVIAPKIAELKIRLTQPAPGQSSPPARSTIVITRAPVSRDDQKIKNALRVLFTSTDPPSPLPRGCQLRDTNFEAKIEPPALDDIIKKLKPFLDQSYQGYLNFLEKVRNDSVLAAKHSSDDIDNVIGPWMYLACKYPARFESGTWTDLQKEVNALKDVPKAWKKRNPLPQALLDAFSPNNKKADFSALKGLVAARLKELAGSADDSEPPLTTQARLKKIEKSITTLGILVNLEKSSANMVTHNTSLSGILSDLSTLGAIAQADTDDQSLHTTLTTIRLPALQEQIAKKQLGFLKSALETLEAKCTAAETGIAKDPDSQHELSLEFGFINSSITVIKEYPHYGRAMESSAVISLINEIEAIRAKVGQIIHRIKLPTDEETQEATEKNVTPIPGTARAEEEEEEEKEEKEEKTASLPLTPQEILQLANYYRKMSFMALHSEYEFDTRKNRYTTYSALYNNVISLLREDKITKEDLIKNLLPETPEKAENEEKYLETHLAELSAPQHIYHFGKDCYLVATAALKDIVNSILAKNTLGGNLPKFSPPLLRGENKARVTKLDLGDGTVAATVERFRTEAGKKPGYIAESYLDKNLTDADKLKSWACSTLTSFFAAAPPGTEKVDFEDGYSPAQLAALISYCEFKDYQYSVGDLQKLRILAMKGELEPAHATLPELTDLKQYQAVTLTVALSELAATVTPDWKKWATATNANFATSQWQEWFNQETTQEKHPLIPPLGKEQHEALLKRYNPNDPNLQPRDLGRAVHRRQAAGPEPEPDIIPPPPPPLPSTPHPSPSSAPLSAGSRSNLSIGSLSIFHHSPSSKPDPNPDPAPSGAFARITKK